MKCFIKLSDRLCNYTVYMKAAEKKQKKNGLTHSVSGQRPRTYLCGEEVSLGDEPLSGLRELVEVLEARVDLRAMLLVPAEQGLGAAHVPRQLVRRDQRHHLAAPRPARTAVKQSVKQRHFLYHNNNKIYCRPNSEVCPVRLVPTRVTKSPIHSG